MARTTLIRTIIALTAVTLPAVASAQVRNEEQISAVRREARGHIGPLYFTPTVSLKELGVDSNVFNAAGEQKSDFTVTVAPKFDLWVPVARRALFQGTATTDLVYYAQYASERSVDPGFTGRAEVYLRRITLFAESSYANTRQRLNYEIDLRARHVQAAGGVGAAVQLTPKFSVELAGAIDETRFDADAHFDGVSLQRTLNQETRKVTVAAKHQFTPLTMLVVRYERMDDEFAFSPARDSESFRVMPGVEFKPRALISGKAYVGYRRFTPSTAGVLPQFSGLVAQLGLSYTLLGSTTFGVTYARDLTYSYEEAQPFFVNNSVGASVRRALGRRFDVLAGADRHTYAYKELRAIDGLPTAPDLLATDAPAQAVTPRLDTTWNYSASLGYRIGQGRIGLGLSYWERDSTTKNFRNYDNLRFGTTVTYGF